MQFKTCQLCGIAEEYGERQQECGHCGGGLLPSKPVEVRGNLPFIRQRAHRSQEEAATARRAEAFAARD